MASRHLKVAALCFLLLLLSHILIWAQLARAHAEYERSEPAADALIPEAPAEVHIWFTEELFRRKGDNVIAVSGPDGTPVDQGDTQIDDDDRKHVFVSLKPELPPGLYSVSWHNVSLEDGHEADGEFNFTIQPAADQTSPQASPTDAQQPAAETPTSIPTSPTPAMPTSALVPTPTPAPAGGLPCLGGLLLGGMFLAAVISGQPRGG